MNKAFVFRIYPNKEQKILLAKTFGCARFIWNKMLSDKKDCYEIWSCVCRNLSGINDRGLLSVHEDYVKEIGILKDLKIYSGRKQKCWLPL